MSEHPVDENTTVGLIARAKRYAPSTYEYSRLLIHQLVRALEAAQPRVVQTVEELEDLVQPFADAGEDIPLRDAAQRYWIVSGDEEGDYWASTNTSRHDFPLNGAPIAFPALVLWVPVQEGN